MSRQRFIDPKMCRSQQYIALSDGARLLFVGIIITCDDYGVRKAHPGLLKADIFPLDIDRHSAKEVAGYRDEITSQDLARMWQHEGEDYLWLPSWTTYQNPKYKAKRKTPEPPDEITGQAQPDDHGQPLCGPERTDSRPPSARSPGQVGDKPGPNPGQVRARGRGSGSGSGCTGVGIDIGARVGVGVVPVAGIVPEVARKPATSTTGSHSYASESDTPNVKGPKPGTAKPRRNPKGYGPSDPYYAQPELKEGRDEYERITKPWKWEHFDNGTWLRVQVQAMLHEFSRAQLMLAYTMDVDADSKLTNKPAALLARLKHAQYPPSDESMKAAKDILNAGDIPLQTMIGKE